MVAKVHEFSETLPVAPETKSIVGLTCVTESESTKSPQNENILAVESASEFIHSNCCLKEEIHNFHKKIDEVVSAVKSMKITAFGGHRNQLSLCVLSRPKVNR